MKMKDWKDWTENLTDKNIKDFQPGDTIYINKIENGYSYFYFCEFISIERGIVKGKIISVHRECAKIDIGKTITARKNKCLLWGKDENDEYTRCHWFNKEGYAK